MALRRWDVDETELPRLSLAPAPPRPRGRAGAASALVLMLIAVLAAPVLRAAERSSVPRQVPRPLAAAGITALDRLPPVPKGGRPRSSEPVGGIAFVRCTHLWVAEPDGTNAHRILDAPGITSPAFSPDARTIAFFAAGTDGPELWMAAADGSSARRIGRITSDGWPVTSQATGLTWSPDGTELAFALVTPEYGPLEGGSSLWSLQLPLGYFIHAGNGWPQPFWYGRHLSYARLREDGRDSYFETRGRDRGTLVRRMSSAGEVRSAAFAPEDWWFLQPRFAAVVLHRNYDGARELLLKMHSAGRHTGTAVAPPSGWTIPRYARPAIAQDGTRAFISLTDAAGSPDLGVLDTLTREWTVLDYAWQPTASPAPNASGPLPARRAQGAANALLSGWNEPGFNAALLAGKRSQRGRLLFERFQYATGAAAKSARGWVVPATVYGDRASGFAAQELSVRVRVAKGRITAHLVDVEAPRPIDTIDDAIAFLREHLTVPVAAPTWLPPGATLSPDGQMPSVSVNATEGSTTGSLNLAVPASGATIRLIYGDAYFWSCGDAGGDPVSVAGAPGLAADDGSGAHQVVWPATVRSYSRRAPDYSVWATLPRRDVLEIADGMAAGD